MVTRFSWLIVLVVAAFAIPGTPVPGSAQNHEPIKLSSAIRLAEENNPELAAMKANIAVARGRAIGFWWLPDPQVSLEWEGVPRGAGLNAYDEKRINLTQEIEFPTNILWRNRLAAREVESVMYEYELARLQIRAEVIDAYTEFISRRDQLALARQRVDLARDFYDKANIRRRVGEAAAIESVRAGVELAQARNELRMAESDYRAARARLNALLGREADREMAASDSLRYIPFQMNLEAIKARAMEQHPQLRLARARLSAAGYVRKLAWGSLLPSIEATGFQQNIGGNPNFYGVQIGFRLPLWFAFRQRGEIQAATSEVAARRYDTMAVRLRLFSRIEAAYALVKAAQEQVRTYNTELLQQADEMYRIVLRSYEEGEVGYLALLEAQRTLIEVHRGYIETLARYQSALAELERSSSIPIFD